MKVQDIFICPMCNGHRIGELMTNVTATSEVLTMTDDGDVSYGTPSLEDGGDGSTVFQYQCMNCGHVLPNISDGAMLHAFLLSTGNPWKHNNENCGQLADKVLSSMSPKEIYNNLRECLIKKYGNDKQLASMMHRRLAQGGDQSEEES